MSTPTTTAPGTNSDSNYTAWAFEPGQIPHAWEELEPFVNEALKHGRGELNANTVYRLLCKGAFYAFTTSRDNRIELVVICEIVQYPLVRKVHVVLLAGRGVVAAQKFMLAFEDWATANGAVEITGYVPEGRGHARLYSRLGFHTAYRVVLKDLRRKLQ